MVEFMVGGTSLVAATPLSLQRLGKMWPAVEGLGKATTRMVMGEYLSQIIAVATEKDEDLIDKESLVDMGRRVARRITLPEIELAQTKFRDLLEASGLGTAPKGEAQAASPLTETGTE